jgi:hypothetical protein
MTTPTPTNLDRTAEIRARVEAATSEQPGPWTVNLWPTDEHDCGAEGEVVNAAGNAALALLGSAAYVALGANALADLAFLLAENDRLLTLAMRMQAGGRIAVANWMSSRDDFSELLRAMDAFDEAQPVNREEVPA